MTSEGRRMRLTEEDFIEGGVRCPTCGNYASFGDVVATGRCGGASRHGCGESLALDLVYGG